MTIFYKSLLFRKAEEIKKSKEKYKWYILNVLGKTILPEYYK